MNILTTIPIEQFGKILKILFFGCFYGYDNLMIKNTKTEEEIKYTNINSGDLYIHEEYKQPCLVIEDLEPGPYEIYSYDKDNNKTISTYVSINGNTKIQSLEKSLKILAYDFYDDEYINSFIAEKIDEDSDLILELYKRYLSETDNNNKYKIASLLNITIDSKNKEFESYESIPTEFNIADTFEIPSIVDSVIVYNFNTDRYTQIDNRENIDSYEYITDYDNLYSYTFLDSNRMPIGIYFRFVPSVEILSRFNGMSDNAKEKYENALNRTLKLPIEYLDFSEREQEYLKVIDNLQPDIPILNGPTVYLDHGFVDVTIDDYDWAIISEANLKDISYFVSFQEPELAIQRDSSKRIEITGQNFNFSTRELHIIKEDYLVWIEDIFGRIISNISLLKLESTNIYKDYTELEDSQEVNNRFKNLYINNYKKHLYPLTLTGFEYQMDKIKDSMEKCLHDPSIFISNLAQELLKFNWRRENLSLFLDLIKCIYMDRTIYGDYKVEFFNRPIIYKYKTDTITMPVNRNVLYIFESFDLETGYDIHYQMSEEYQSTDFRFRNSEFGIVSAIDLNTNKRSGFVLIDFYSGKKNRASLSKYLIDAVEVIY